MLKAVSIGNVAVIKELNIDFSKGFTVITGETGAGKSILVDSIAFLLGARASKEMIRTGEKRAEVSGLFDLPRQREEYLESIGILPDENGEIYITRYITDEGKSGARINGKSVPLSILKSASKSLMAIHGQQDQIVLSEKSELIELLDDYIGFDEDMAKYRGAYMTLSELEERLKSLKESLNDRAMMVDILSYQLKEIDSAKLRDPEEEEKLLRMRTKLLSLEKVTKNVNTVTRALLENEKGITAAYMLDKASGAIRALSDVIENAEELADKLETFKYEIIDISERVSDILSGEDISDPEKKLDLVESRLSLIKKLKGKYAENISGILAKRDEIKTKLSDLENSDDALSDLENSIKDAVIEAAKYASVLSAKRKEAAAVLNRSVTETLADLDMPKVIFKIDVTERKTSDPRRFDANGFDEIEFLVSTNVGEDMQPISKIASGGELSRIMLAVKNSMMTKSAGVTSVFDEIDAGVSGATSERIGLKLAEMSRKSQLICITHSAQIASLADTHLKISKHESAGRVESKVETLDKAGRVRELSRIIGGIDITEKQIKAATEMLEKYERI